MSNANSSPFATAPELTNALQRYESEAQRAAFWNGRYLCHYAIWGESTRPPLVFVHGMSDQIRAFAMVMARLVDQGFRCVGFELPNGVSDRACLGNYKHSDYTLDLISLLDFLELEQVDLIGSSYGTAISIRSLATHPQRFRRAVLKGAFARRPLKRFERGVSRLGRYWPWRMGQLPFRRQELIRMEGAAFAGCSPEIFEFLLRCSGEAPIRAAALRTLLLDRLDLRPWLPLIPHDVLILRGNLDQIVYHWCEEEVAQGLRRARVLELAPCGHYPQYSLPGPTADAIARFLK